MLVKLGQKNAVYFVIILGFILGWFLFFGLNAFLNNKGVMNQGLWVPNLDSVGYDLEQTINSSKELLNGRTPYVLKLYSYPPLSAVIFIPFTYLPFQVAYLIIVLLTVTFFILSFVMLEKIWVSKNKDVFLTPLLVIVSFYSYGFQFEIERGQFNIIALGISLIGLFLFYKNHKVWGVVLLVLGAQLKIYPAILSLMILFADSRLKNNIGWFLLFVLLNLVLLFAGGVSVFRDFLSALFYQMRFPYYWIGNHSLLSYCSGESGMSFCSFDTYRIWLSSYILMLLTAVLLTLRNLQYRVYFFTLVAFGMLLIPSASHDYTLSLLPIIILPICKEYITEVFDNRNIYLVFLLILFFLLTGLSISINATPEILLAFQNRALMLILLIVLVFISLLQKVFIKNAKHSH